MVAHMDNNPRPEGENWTKQDVEDAARLLERFEQRKEKASGGFQRPEKFKIGRRPSVVVRGADWLIPLGWSALISYPAAANDNRPFSGGAAVHSPSRLLGDWKW